MKFNLRKDLSGQVYTRLTVIRPIDKSKNRNIIYECLCECGKTTRVTSSNLIGEKVRSCGCLLTEKRGKATITHGMSNSPTYKTWCEMIYRCTNPNSHAYFKYGGRGITVCPEWLSSFESFLKDMGERPINHSLDRIDNDKGYCKSNCRWANAKTQANNRRSNLRLLYKGKYYSVKELSDISGIPEKNIRSRISLGWDLDKVLKQPLKSFSKK